MHLLLARCLPARQTDLAFASLVEQWGLLAGVLALLAVVTIVWRLVVTATRSHLQRRAVGGQPCRPDRDRGRTYRSAR